MEQRPSCAFIVSERSGGPTVELCAQVWAEVASSGQSWKPGGPLVSNLRKKRSACRSVVLRGSKGGRTVQRMLLCHVSSRTEGTTIEDAGTFGPRTCRAKEKRQGSSPSPRASQSPPAPLEPGLRERKRQAPTATSGGRIRPVGLWRGHHWRKATRHSMSHVTSLPSVRCAPSLMAHGCWHNGSSPLECSGRETAGCEGEERAHARMRTRTRDTSPPASEAKKQAIQRPGKTALGHRNLEPGGCASALRLHALSLARALRVASSVAPLSASPPFLQSLRAEGTVVCVGLSRQCPSQECACHGSGDESGRRSCLRFVPCVCYGRLWGSRCATDALLWCNGTDRSATSEFLRLRPR
jgi:hypothetical protein